MRRLLFHHPLRPVLAGLVALGLTACGGGTDAGASAEPVARSAALERDDAGAVAETASPAGAVAPPVLLAADDAAAQFEQR